MANPFVYYRADALEDLKRVPLHPVTRLDWREDLAMIRRLYARFGKDVDPDRFEQYVGSPLAIVQDGEIVSFAIPLSFRDGETEIGGAATVPDRRNRGYCKALLSGMACMILKEGKAAALTTEQSNLPMRKAAEAVGMKRVPARP